MNYEEKDRNDDAVQPAQHAAQVQDAGQPNVLTRAQVAALLGRSVSGVRVLENAGVLHPRRGRRGVRLFDATEIETIVRSRSRRVSLAQGAPEIDGPLTARVFRMLREGVAPDEIAIQLELVAESVEHLCAAWARLRGGMLLPPDARAKLRDAGVDVDGADELVDRVLALAAPPDCGRCRKRPAAVCAKCANRAAG